MKRYAAYVRYACGAAIIGIALMLRFYDFHRGVAFHGDHARDLFIARGILHDGLRPAFGPQLSVDGFSIPPTYFYILAGAYAVFATPYGVAFVFGVMSLASAGMLVYLSYRLMGRDAAYIMGALCAVSAVLVSQSRSFWQPYPVLWGVTASLVVFYHAVRRASLIRLFVSYLLFAFSVSVYPSAVMLIPYFLGTGAMFLSRSRGKTNGIAPGMAVFVMVAAFVPFYGPYVIRGPVPGEPTSIAYPTAAIGLPPTVAAAVRTYSFYVTEFMSDAFGLRAIPALGNQYAVPYAAWGLAVFVFCAGRFRYRRGYPGPAMTTSTFLAFPLLVAGSAMLLFFRPTAYSYRVHVFLPFLLLALTDALHAAIRSRRGIPLLLAGLGCAAYLVGNAFALRGMYSYPDEVGLAARTASGIGYDAARSGIRSFSVSVSSNYFIFPFLYYLKDQARVTVPYSAYGNTVQKSSAEDASGYDHSYFVCMVAPPRVTGDVCENEFLYTHPEFTAEKRLPMEQNAYVIRFARSGRTAEGKTQ